MVVQIERGQNTHGKGEGMKIPLLPNNVGKKSVNNSGPTVGSGQVWAGISWNINHTTWLDLMDFEQDSIL